MQLSDLITSVYEDLEPWITEVRLTPSGDQVVVLECDDWVAGGSRRRFLLRCSGVKDASVSLGDASPIDWVAEHPVLATHIGDQAALYFSSAPANPAEVFLAVHEELTSWQSGWIEPGTYLNGNPSEIARYLATGSGLLARGPRACMERIQLRLQSLLRTNVVHSYHAKGGCKALLLGSMWIACESVSVSETPPPNNGA